LFYGNSALTYGYEALAADVAPAVLTPATTIISSRIEYNPGTYSIDVCVADLDGNGREDIVVADFNVIGANQSVVSNASTSSFTIVFQQ